MLLLQLCPGTFLFTRNSSPLTITSNGFSCGTCRNVSFTSRHPSTCENAPSPSLASSSSLILCKNNVGRSFSTRPEVTGKKMSSPCPSAQSNSLATSLDLLFHLLTEMPSQVAMVSSSSRTHYGLRVVRVPFVLPLAPERLHLLESFLFRFISYSVDPFFWISFRFIFSIAPQAGPLLPSLNHHLLHLPPLLHQLILQLGQRISFQLHHKNIILQLSPC